MIFINDKWNKINLVKLTQQFQSVNQLTKEFNNIHKKLNSFGGVEGHNEDIFRLYESCYKRYNVVESQYTDMCPKVVVSKYLNCTHSLCLEKLNYAQTYYIQNDNRKWIALAFGVENEGYRFSTVLGIDESESSRKSVNIERLLMPLEFLVWIFLLILASLLACILFQSGV